MYFFYFDESGAGGTDTNKEQPNCYVLLAVGMYENHWPAFDQEITRLKLELAGYLKRDKKISESADLADYEVKSNWIRAPKDREIPSEFIANMDTSDRDKLVEVFFSQLEKRRMVVIACVVDRRKLKEETSPVFVHEKAYELILERIQHYMSANHPKHKAIMVMDNTGKNENQKIALNHAKFQRHGNVNMRFRQIVEYPFFVQSELSNGVQLADLLAYCVFRAFEREEPSYAPLQMIVPHLDSRDKESDAIEGIKIWPPSSKFEEIKSQIEKAKVEKEEEK